MRARPDLRFAGQDGIPDRIVSGILPLAILQYPQVGRMDIDNPAGKGCQKRGGDNTHIPGKHHCIHPKRGENFQNPPVISRPEGEILFRVISPGLIERQDILFL